MGRLSMLRRKKIEKVAFFLHLGLPSTLICDENRAFPKVSSIGGIWKSRLENVAFRVISLTKFSSLAYSVNTLFLACLPRKRT